MPWGPVALLSAPRASRLGTQCRKERVIYRDLGTENHTFGPVRGLSPRHGEGGFLVSPSQARRGLGLWTGRLQGTGRKCTQILSPHSGGNRGMQNWTLRWVLVSPPLNTWARCALSPYSTRQLRPFQQSRRGQGGGPHPAGRTPPRRQPAGGGGQHRWGRAVRPSWLRTRGPSPAENHAHPEAAPGHVPGPEPEVAAHGEGQGGAGPRQQGQEGPGWGWVGPGSPWVRWFSPFFLQPCVTHSFTQPLPRTSLACRDWACGRVCPRGLSPQSQLEGQATCWGAGWARAKLERSAGRGPSALPRELPTSSCRLGRLCSTLGPRGSGGCQLPTPPPPAPPSLTLCTLSSIPIWSAPCLPLGSAPSTPRPAARKAADTQQAALGEPSENPRDTRVGEEGAGAAAAVAPGAAERGVGEVGRHHPTGGPGHH